MDDDAVSGRSHLHLEDYPATLALLADLLEPKRYDPVWLADAGYEPTEHGAWIDWDRLATSWLAATEVAIVHIARGVAILERAGGPPPRLSHILRTTVANLTP